MSNQIVNIVRFTGLVVGVPVVQVHNLQQDGRGLVPDFGIPNIGGFDITADDTNVTVERTAAAASGDVDVWLIHLHTFDREYGAINPPPGNLPDGSLTPQPFIVEPGAAAAIDVDRYLVPELYGTFNIAAGQANVDMTTTISSVPSTTAIAMVRGGSITGINVSLVSAIVAGTMTVEATINGALAGFGVALVAGLAGIQALQPAGVSPYVAGDSLGMRYTTDAAYIGPTEAGSCYMEVTL
jgi:hypothetical protein